VTRRSEVIALYEGGVFGLYEAGEALRAAGLEVSYPHHSRGEELEPRQLTVVFVIGGPLVTDALRAAVRRVASDLRKKFGREVISLPDNGDGSE
jgi:hypothetical protein